MATTLSIKNKAPHWLIMTTAVCSVLLTSKSLLIDLLPIDKELLEIIGAWYIWILNAVTSMAAVGTILVGVKPDGAPPIDPQ